MNSNQSQERRHEQFPRQDGNASTRQGSADQADDINTSEPPEGKDGRAPGRGDSNRTPWQQQTPVDRPPRPQQGDAVGSEQQRRRGSLSEDTDDAGETQPNLDNTDTVRST